jgi:hypothetical protein
MTDQESWDNWRAHVLSEIKRMNQNAQTIHNDVLGLRVDIETLKVKSGIWGLLGGMIPVIVLIVLEKIK